MRISGGTGLALIAAAFVTGVLVGCVSLTLLLGQSDAARAHRYLFSFWAPAIDLRSVTLGEAVHWVLDAPNSPSLSIAYYPPEIEKRSVQRCYIGEDKLDYTLLGIAETFKCSYTPVNRSLILFYDPRAIQWHDDDT